MGMTQDQMITQAILEALPFLPSRTIIKVQISGESFFSEGFAQYDNRIGSGAFAVARGMRYYIFTKDNVKRLSIKIDHVALLPVVEIDFYSPSVVPLRLI